MTERERSWVTIATYAAGYEADIAIARLDAAGIDAMRRGNDTVGIFGPGFEGRSAHGIEVLVPSDLVEEAREALLPMDGAV